MLIYYINVAEGADGAARRAFMAAQFAQLGLSANRIDAVTPADLTADDHAAIRRIDAASSMVFPYVNTLSHLAAMRALLAGDAPHALILEDDAVLSRRLPAFLAAYDAAPPVGVDLLRLETSLHLLRLKPTDTEILGFSICRAYSFEGGRAAYIITRKAAAVIVRSREVLLLPHDVSMFDPYEPLPRRLDVRQLNPALCIQAQYVATGKSRFLGSPRPAPTAREMGLRAWLRQAWRAVRRDTIVAVQKAWHQHVRGAKKQRVVYQAD
jgi:glycosyl transferase family 25